MAIVYHVVTQAQEFELGRKLFRQYADSLNVDLCFQNFDEELEHIDKHYGKPKGALLLAFDESKAIGCACIRALDDTTAELKRMYVIPEYRGRHIGKKLLLRCLELAKQLRYKKIRLDTLPTMKKAQDLYRSLGFHEIAAYRHNPVGGTIYMEKELDPRQNEAAGVER